MLVFKDTLAITNDVRSDDSVQYVYCKREALLASLFVEEEAVEVF